MRYLSVCSGIEAASCAWHPLGWEAVAFSEIEAFPSAVLAHHYLGVPNWGDMTKFKEWPDATFDVLVGGTPCQSFSVAGLRKGLADPRGNLALTYLALADRYRPEWLVWENVPGVLSSGGGRDFGAFLGGLGELGYGWAYRVLDAQYFGLAQRRKRVFVVANSRSWQRAAAVLFDSASLRGDSAPRRETGQAAAASLRTRAPGSGGQGTDWEHTVAGTMGSRATAGGGFGGDFEAAGGLQPVLANALMARDGASLTAPDFQTFIPEASGGWPAEIASTLNAAFGDKQGLEDQHALGGASLFVSVVGALTAKGPTGMGAPEVDAGHYIVAHSLRAEGFDASEDGTGRGTPIVAEAIYFQDDTTPKHGAVVGALRRDAGGEGACVAFSVKDHGADAGPLSPTLRSGGHDKSHANGGVMPAIAFAQNSRDEVRLQGGDGQIVGALAAEPGMKQTTYLQTAMQVRRLTPVECARLQGFSDTYLDITYRGKPAADGNKYKALGNSMAVPVMHWIGQRIQQVSDIQEAEATA